MVKIVTYEKPQDFLNANRERIYGNYFAHYHLITRIEDLKHKRVELYECYNVVDDQGSDVLCMWTTVGYFIYSFKWTPEILAALVDKVQLKKFKRYIFSGQREVVKQLFELSGVKGEVFKNRFIEACFSTLPLAIPSTGRGNNGSFDDFDELVQLLIDYNAEEFRGGGSRTPDDIANSLERSIDDNSTYVWRVNGEITSVVQRINDHDDYALLGGFYTKPAFRGKSYGYQLLHAVTTGILESGQICGLVSDADNPVTAKIFARIGYNPVYEWVSMRQVD